MKKFEKYERRGLPGGPNEITSYMTGAISTQGYKSNSPDKYNDFNIITSGNITMEDVDFPVFGMDNLGNMAAMMPGANYKFPGDMVFEMPMAQEGIETVKLAPITYYDMLNAAYPGQYEFTTNTQRYYGDEPTIDPRTQTITSKQIPFQYDFVIPIVTSESPHSLKYLMPRMKGTNDRPESDKFEEKIRSNKNPYLDKDDEIIARNIVDDFLQENIQDIIANPSEYYLTDKQPISHIELGKHYGKNLLGERFSGDISDFLETKPGMPEAEALYLKRYYDDSYEGMSGLTGYDNYSDELHGRQAHTARYHDYDSESAKPYRGEVYERLFDLSPVGIAGGRLFELAYRPGYTQYDVATTEARLKPPEAPDKIEFDRDKFMTDAATANQRDMRLSQNFLIDYLEKEPSRAGKTYYYYDDDEGNILYATGQPRFGAQGKQTGEEQEYLRQFEQFTNKDGTLKTPKVISLKDNPKKFKEIEDKIYQFAYQNIEGATPTFQGQSNPGGGIMRKDFIPTQEIDTRQRGGSLFMAQQGIEFLDPNRSISSQASGYTQSSEADRIAVQDAMNQANAERADIRGNIQRRSRLDEEAQALGFNNYEEYSIAKARENAMGVDNTFTTQASDLGMYNTYLPEIIIQSDPGKPTVLGSEFLGSLFPAGGAEVIPYVGDAIDGVYMADAIRDGNYEDAFWHGLGFVTPFVGGYALKKLFNRAGKSSIKPNKTFQSEIDWGKWNEEIPLNKELMQEYHTIEEVTKAKGTWMKNPDGSPFEGSPELFVQTQSNNFLKAFPDGYVPTYRGMDERGYSDELIAPRNKGHFTGVFTGSKDIASDYGKPYSLAARKSDNSLTIDGLNTSWNDLHIFKSKPALEKHLEYQKKLLDNYDSIYGPVSDPEAILNRSNNLRNIQERINNLELLLKNWDESNVQFNGLVEYMNSGNFPQGFATDDLASYLEKAGLDNVSVKNIYDMEFGDVLINNQVPGNYLKSLDGNNGMFDMSNPSIYKQRGGEQASQDFLRNWYQNRVLSGDNSNALTDEMRQALIDRVNIAPNAQSFPLVLNDAADPSILGQNSRLNNAIYIKPDASDDVYLHELTHFAENNPYQFDIDNIGGTASAGAFNLYRPEMFDILNQPGVQQDYLRYVSKPTETSARLMTIRERYSDILKPDKVVTKEDLRKIFKKEADLEDETGKINSDVDDLLKLYGPDGLLKILNEYVSAEPQENIYDLPMAQKGKKIEMFNDYDKPFNTFNDKINLPKLNEYKDSPSIEDYGDEFYSMVINNAYDKSIGFHKDWLHSAMYDKMLTESTQGEDGLFDKETIDFGRTWNLDRIDRDNQYLYFDPYNTSAAFAVTNSYSGNPQAYYNLAHPAYEGEFNTNFNNIYPIRALQSQKLFQDRLEDAMVEEMGHLSVRPIIIPGSETDKYFKSLSGDMLDNAVDYYSNIPLSDRELIRSLQIPRSEAPSDLKYDYITDPGEVRERLNRLRFAASEGNIYDPFNEKATMSNLLKLKDTKAFKDLKHIYDDDEILQLLNTISQAEPQQDVNEIPMAQKGGGKTKYVGETDQGGYIVGVDVDRGDRQRSKSFSLEPSGDTSYSRSVTTPKGSRTKSIDIVDGEAIKTITRTRNGETTERTKTLSDRKADRLGERYARKVNRVFTDPFPEVPNPNEGKFTIEYEQGGEAAAPDFGSYGLSIEDTLLFPRYINYINGNDESIEARRVYDKLNRKVYRYAKQGGMTAPNYMMTEVLRLGGSV